MRFGSALFLVVTLAGVAGWQASRDPAGQQQEATARVAEPTVLRGGKALSTPRHGLTAVSPLSQGAHTAGTGAAAPSGMLRFEARVQRVIDGDTLRLVGVSTRIRVWGLDAPEVGEAGGAAATRALEHLVRGQSLSCVIRDTDRHGRHVGQCFLTDGRDIAAEMIRTGAAREYCRFTQNHYQTCR